MKASHKDTSSYQVAYEMYVSLTNLSKEESDINNWINDSSTIECLGLWEAIHNPAFKKQAFEHLTKKSGTDSSPITPQKWIELTHSLSLVDKTDQQNQIYAHPDIALHFCMWLNPLFKLLVLKEFQQLKVSKHAHSKWSLTNYLSKASP